MRFMCLIFLSISILSSSVFGFGKNKVQYQKSDWKMIQSIHFDIYFTADALPLAEHSADQIENMYQDVSALLGHQLSTRVPIIIHRSHQHFVETNVIRMALPEAVGGFTEVFKNRIVLPFNGSWNEFDHVLKHELVHALMFDQFSGQGGGVSLAQRMAHIPLWFKEGLAEYASLGWNMESEFYLLDAVSTGYIVHPKYNFGGFLAYKGGQSFIYYLVEQFGEKVISQIIRDLVRGYSFEMSFEMATQVSLEEVGELWIRELRRIYWPELGRRDYPKSFARQLTFHEKDPSHFNLAPAISPDGKRMIYFTDKEDWEGLQLMEIQGRKDLGRILKSGSKGEHESLHPFSSGFSWASDNKTIAFVSKQKGRDVIHVMDVDLGEVIEVIDPQLDMILNPAFNPANPQELTFSGASKTQQDLYIYDRQSETLHQITQDKATQNAPQFSPNGNLIVFQTNQLQGPQIAQDNNSLVLYHRDTQQFEVLVNGYAQSPQWMGNNYEVAYVSNHLGLSNVFYFDLKTKQSQALTNTISATFTPNFTSDGQHMVFALFERGGWDIYMMHHPKHHASQLQPQPTHYFKRSTPNYFLPISLENMTSFKEKVDSSTIDSNNVISIESTDGLTDSLTRENQKELITQNKTAESFFDNEDEFAEEKEKNDDSLDSTKDISRIQSNDLDTGYYVYDAPQPDSNSFLNRSHKDSLGRYIIRDYETQWSLDQAQALAGAATNGSNVNFGGQAFLTFTDLMGDQEISAMIYGAGGSYEDINFGGMYRYLPYRWDFGVSINRFVNYTIDSSQINTQTQMMSYGEAYADSVTLNSSDVLYSDDNTGKDTLISTAYCAYHSQDRVDTLYTVEERSGQSYCSRLDRFRDNNFNAQIQLIYPIDIFMRVGLHLSANAIERQRMLIKSQSLTPDLKVLPRTLAFIHPGISYSFDNIRWGYTGPINGNRSIASLQYFPKMSSNPTDYFVAQADIRNYFRFFKRYTLAWRVSAGSALGNNQEKIPYRFLVGGDNFNLLPRINFDNRTGRLIDNYHSSIDDHLRGFDYLDFAGQNKFVTNLDWRFPLIERLDIGWPIRVPFRDIQGVLIADYGGAWSRGNPLESMGLGVGWGWRMNIGYLVLRYTKAWSLSDIGPIKRPPRSYWSLGAEF